METKYRIVPYKGEFAVQRSSWLPFVWNYIGNYMGPLRFVDKERARQKIDNLILWDEHEEDSRKKEKQFKKDNPPEKYP